MIRNQIKKYPRKILSFGKRIIKKIYSITETDQDTHVHIQKQTSVNTEAENSSENISEKMKNTSQETQSHSEHEELVSRPNRRSTHRNLLRKVDSCVRPKHLWSVRKNPS